MKHGDPDQLIFKELKPSPLSVHKPVPPYISPDKQYRTFMKVESHEGGYVKLDNDMGGVIHG